jgi:hypothetical protein
VGLTLALLPACGPSGVPSASSGPIENTQLDEVYEIVKQHVEQKKALPRGVGDLKNWQLGFPTGFFAVQSGAVVVAWGTPPSESGDAVLAYEKDVPAKGGLVILQNRTVKQVTPDEFKAAAKSPKG